MNATADAAAAKKAQTALAKAIRQRNNVNSAKFLAAGTVSMMVLFIIFHWTRYVFKRYESRTTGGNTLVKFTVLITRKARNLLLRKVPGFTSLGHALVFVGYFATCIAIAFTNLDWTSLNNWAKRLGWVTVSNIALITFLALKNTPLAFLSAYSYERLNILHQIAGYGTVFWAMMHAVVYITAWSKSDSLPELKETANVMGIVAGFAMLIILSTSLLLRKLRYEFWYITHIIMFMLILIAVGMHRPLISKRVVVIVIFTAGIWVSDRAVRFSKISLFSFGNAATVTPLPHGGTRIVLRKSSSRAKPGKHCFLWIPKVRATETHPFTIISSDKGSLSFVVAAYDGFTRDLHNYAVQNPGASLKASIDGPYGTVPNFTAFTKLVLIAGGSGGSFTFGVAIDTVRKLGSSTATTIEFIWAVREQESITWYSSELQELIASHLVTLRIHSTRSTSTTNPYTITHTPKSSAPSLEDDEKVYLSGTDTNTVTPASAAIDIDIEKHHDITISSQPRSLTVRSGRPDISGIIKEIIGRADRHDRVAVVACGPDSLMAVTRETTARCIKSDGPSVELHCEQFGW